MEQVRELQKATLSEGDTAGPGAALSRRSTARRK